MPKIHRDGPPTFAEPVALLAPGPARPAPRASVGDWRAYAVALGTPPETAAELTKAELIERADALEACTDG